MSTPNEKPKAIPSVAELDMRDYFAGQVIAYLTSQETTIEQDATCAYAIADALLKAREA
jgi:hypothetical protein